MRIFNRFLGFMLAFLVIGNFLHSSARAADGMIAFSTLGGSSGLELHVINPDGTRERNLNVPLSTYEPRLGPSGQKIVFTVTGGAGNTDGIYTLDSNGTSLQKIFAPGSTPSLSPDNLEIAYSGEEDIKRRKADGTTISYTSTPAISEFRPRYSPDGLGLVYEDGKEIYKRVFTSGTSVNLTNNAANDTYPSYSPDGSKIVFNSKRTPAGIYIMNADGTSPTRIPNTAANGFDACFSPDGTRIVYQASDGLHVININGTGDTLILADTNASHPTWAPGDVPPLASVSDATVTEGNSGTTNLTFTITLSRKADAAQTVSYETSSVTAFAPGDYAAKSGSVTFAAGQNSKTVTIPIVGDTFYERNETFKITLTEASVAILNDFEGVGTIVNDDSIGTFNGKIAFDSNRGGNRDIYVMNADGSKVQRLTTAADGDYAPAFSPDGRRIAFHSFRDGNYEIYIMNADGSGQTRLTNNTASDLDPQWTPDGTQIFFATNRDGQYEIYKINPDGSGPTRMSNRSSNERDPTLSPDGQFLLLSYDGNGNADIARGSGSLLFNAPNPFDLTTDTHEDTEPVYKPDGGQIAFVSNRDGRSRIYVMDALGNSEVPVTTNIGNEYSPCYSPDGLKFAFTYDLTNREIFSMNTIGNGAVNLTNDAASDQSPSWAPGDVLPGISIGDVQIIEGDSGTKNLTFTATLSWNSTQTVTVNYATSDGPAQGAPATAGSDYTAKSGTLTFTPGITTALVSVPILGDTAFEADENFALTLSAPTNAEITDGSATGTIANDESQLSINDVAITEGADAATVNATFTVTLAPVSTKPITVKVASASGTTFPATVNSDYTALPATTLTFSPGQTSKTVTVSIKGDALDEENETFFVNLSAPVNATLADAQGLGTITDDDAAARFSIAPNVSVAEGNATGGSATFTVTLTPASGRTTTVTYQTRALGATEGTDYTAKSGTLTFAPGETSKTVTANFIGDTTPELDESFFVDLKSVTNASINVSADTARATILNDDGPVLYIQSRESVFEGNTGNTPQVFDVILSEAAPANVTVNWATASGTANALDYTAASGTLTFTPGQTSKTITVQVKGDTYSEADESYVVNLSNASGAYLLIAQASGLIEDDDFSGSLGLEVADAVSVAESGNLTFTVTLSNVAAQNITVNYATGAATATAGTDYTTKNSTLTILAGQTSATLNVAILPDSLDEANETFLLNISNPTGGALLRDAQAVGTITDDDAAPTLSVADAVIVEGNPAQGTAIASVVTTLSAANGQSVTVNLATANGTALAPGDYTALSQTLTFSPGETTKSVFLTIISDALDEDDETLGLQLSNAANATIADASGIVTITDDDAAPSATINDPVSLYEGSAAAPGSATFTVTLSAASGKTVTLRYFTSDGTATSGADYVAKSGVIVFAPGETFKRVTVNFVGDAVAELNETLFLDIRTPNDGTPANATIADSRGSHYIKNDDGPGIVIDNAVTVDEGNSGTRAQTFNVHLSAASTNTITVDWTTANNTAGPADYTVASGTLTFLPGETSKTITVLIKGDTAVEATETYRVNIAHPTYAVLADSQGVGYIRNDDVTPLTTDEPST